ncbi:calcium-binding protein, partial [Sulfitobacter sp.]|uniref:calcium-binding protein n=1 Tax=Sulfitobacter sp. TaxID=1903071 RepID=UPI003001D801
MATPTTWLSEFQANTGTANTPTTSDPQTIGLSNGNILVAWTESGITGVGTAAGFDIIGKIYDGAGNLVRDSYRINTVRNVDEESDFDIAPTNDGGFILVYVDNDGVDSAVLWERKNAAGNNLNSREIISETGAGDYDNPQVAVNNIDNSSFVTYTSFNPSAFLDPADEDVLAVRLSAVGAIITAEFEAARDAPIFSADDQTQNDVAININGEMISAYIDEGTVKVDVYATTGLYLHTATVDTNGSPSDPQVATLSGGNIVVTWTDDVAGFSSGDVNHAVFNSDLGVVLAKTTIDSVDANESAIVALPNDEYIVVWDDDNIATNDIKAQKFDSDGSADGAVFTVDVSLGTSPDIGVTGDGRVIFAWSAASNVYTSIWDPRDGTIFAGDYADSEENFVDAAIIWAKIAGGPLNGSGNTDDHLIGMSGNDSILGYLGNDTLEGNAGDDWLFGNRGDDSLLGGAGDDTFEYFSDISFESFSDMTAGTDTIEGGAGTDQITIIEGGTTLLNAVGTQWSGLERINFFAADFFGGDKTLRVRGDELTDGFTSGIAIVGRPDANLREIIEVFMHSDASIDLSGTTFTNWTDGFDYVEIKGDESDETITGTSASDYVSGWDGDDDIILTAATTGLEETIHGGDGYDEIMINSSGVIDLSNSGTEISGIEEIRFNASGASMLRLATDETDSATELLNVIINGYSGLATDRNLIEVVVNTIDTDLSGWTFLQWDNASGDDEFIRIIGNANAQNVVGSIVRDQFELGAGNDTIDGRAGNDTIIATAGQNEMDGGADDDLFMLAAGALLNQTIVGGAGDDMLDLSLVAGSSSTFVTAFEIDGGYSANGAAFSGDWSELENLTGTSGYRNNITGNDSANILTGGNLGDTIDGGLGDDTLFGLSGNDTINGGSGKDDVSGGL